MSVSVFRSAKNFWLNSAATPLISSILASSSDFLFIKFAVIPKMILKSDILTKDEGSGVKDKYLNKIGEKCYKKPILRY